MSETMINGLILMGMGMGVVFVVLFAIYLGIVALGIMDKKFPEPKKAAATIAPRNTKMSQGGPTDEERAAIKAALAHHLGKKADEFDVRFM